MTTDRQPQDYTKGPLHRTGDGMPVDCPLPPLAPPMYEQDWGAGTLSRITPADPLGFVDGPFFAKAFVVIIAVAFAAWIVGTAFFN